MLPPWGNWIRHLVLRYCNVKGGKIKYRCPPLSELPLWGRSARNGGLGAVLGCHDMGLSLPSFGGSGSPAVRLNVRVMIFVWCCCSGSSPLSCFPKSAFSVIFDNRFSVRLVLCDNRFSVCLFLCDNRFLLLLVLCDIRLQAWIPRVFFGRVAGPIPYDSAIILL